MDLADDGVLNIPLNLPHCKLTTFKYQVNVINPVPDLYVNVWFDWNRDGDWDDASTCILTPAPEWAVQNQLLFNLPVGLWTITTPGFLPWHPTGTMQPIWMRITLSEQPWTGSGAGMTGNGGSGPVAGYKYGETEDYYFVPTTSYLNIVDLNADGIVNLKDIGIIVNYYLEVNP